MLFTYGVAQTIIEIPVSVRGPTLAEFWNSEIISNKVAVVLLISSGIFLMAITAMLLFWRKPLGPDGGVVPTNFWGFHRVVRGGGWLDDARGCRSAYRFRVRPRASYTIIGFRVVCEVTEDPE